MKPVRLLAMAAVATLAALTTPSDAQNSNGAKISFEKEVHDYGNIKAGANGTSTFVFTNTGTAPLVITDAKGSSGGTVPSWRREPIAPGARSEITVKYDTRRTGPISKSITVTSNAVNEPTKVIHIKGKVE